MTTLQQRINALRILGTHGDFIPQSSLYALLSRTVIADELRRNNYPPEELSEAADLLAAWGRKVFAILVEIDAVNSTAEFLSAGLLDGKLHLRQEDFNHFNDPGLTVKFLKFQWDYIAPIWGDGSSSHKVLSTEAILPFTEEKPVSEGSFGLTFMITLKSTHQGFFESVNTNDVKVVRKELVSNWSNLKEIPFAKDNRMLQNFKQEVRVLKLLRHTRNSRVVEILGSYIHKNKYNLLFPVADMDLEDLFTGGRASSFFAYRDDIFEELRGLASALEDVHLYRCEEIHLELTGCHHDLKPSNILIFNGRLTLADFGLSRLIPPEQGSNTDFKDCLGDYFSPECLDSSFSRQKIGRPSDIWSFGCLVAELVTFYEFGSSGISNFRSSRKTKVAPRYTASWFHSGGKLKPEVDDWLSKLSTNSQENNFKTLIALTRTMLDNDPDSRPRVSTVQLQLTSMTLVSIAERVTERFMTFLENHGDFNLDIELNRFREWADGAGGTIVEHDSHTGDTQSIAQLWSGYRQHILAIFNLIPDTVATDQIQERQYSAEDLEDLYLSIREHNDALWRLLPLETRKIMRVRWHRHQLATTQLDQIKALEQKPDSEIASLATMKRLYLLMEESTNMGEPSPLDTNDITFLTPFGDHHLALYAHPASSSSATTTNSNEEDQGQEPVLIEWWLIDDWDPSLLDELFVRMSSIASLPNVPHRPLEFRVLDCKGFFFDEPKHRFGVVYALPPPPSPSPSPSPFPPAEGPSPSPQTKAQRTITSLRTFIDEHQSISQGTRPPLGSRFALALALCLCVAEFHAVGWLHHDLCADNIVFFIANANANANAPPPPLLLLHTPYIIGFNHSRPDEAGNCSVVQRSSAGRPSSRSIYQHPAYHHRSPPSGAGSSPRPRPRYTRAFDYYALGVVLLEIGLWYDVYKLDGITETMNGEGGGARRKRRREKLIEYARRLGAYVGEIWQEAVLFCLGLEDQDQDQDRAGVDVDVDVEEEFYTKVVEPLAGCRA